MTTKINTNTSTDPNTHIYQWKTNMNQISRYIQEFCLHLLECILFAFQFITITSSIMFVIDGSKDSTGSGKIFLVLRYYHCYNWWRFSTIGSTKGDVNIARLLLFGRPPLNQVITPQPLPEPVSIIIIIIINIFNIII